MKEHALKNLAIELKREALGKGYSISLPTAGNSMWPILADGNCIEIIRCNSGQLKPGNIVLYKPHPDKSSVIAHRLIIKIKRKKEFIFITKGDTVMHFDRAVQEEAIFGKISQIKKGKFIIHLDGFAGTMLNILMLFLSLSGAIALVRLFTKITRV